MLRVALTGGIGAGKSTALRHLAGLGYAVVDSDRLARQVVEPGSPGLSQVMAEFGPGVLTGDGSLDRAALGRIVFADPLARARLEEITHPLIRRESHRIQAVAEASGAVALICDIPLLVETGQAGEFDLVVTIAAPAEVRLARLAARGMSPGQAQARIAAQVTDAERAAVAQVILDGSSTDAELRAQIDRELIPAIHALAEAHRPAPPAPTARP
ncbi:MAG: dephospho-CoA kinase [Bifidobacteriaceae bacterium]|nr:dephospho-CoA kinase [Bifidobacteriaceae bacterium]